MKKIFYCLILMIFNSFLALPQSNSTHTQTIRGVVYDKNFTTPLEGASINIIGLATSYTTVSDNDGKFKIENIPVGRYEIKVQLPMYKSIILTNQLVNSGKELVLDIYMEEDILEMTTIELKIEKDKSKANNSLITNSVTNLRTEEINRFAGSRSDPSRMASNYAGVAGGGDQRNDIIVRGNSPLGVLWRLEGVDIPNPNHFTSPGSSGGAFSILNANLLANSDFITGAFPSEYGNRTSAVFDVKMRNGNNEKRESTFQLGLNGIEFATEGPISKKSGSSYLASYRFLTFGPIQKLGVDIGANGIPQFQDFTLKINQPTKKMGVFTAWRVVGTSTIDMTDEVKKLDSIPNPTTKFESTYSTKMYASGLSNEHRFGKKTKGKLIFSVSGNIIDWNEKNIRQDGNSFNNGNFTNNDGQYLATYTISHKINIRHFVKSGIIIRNIYFDNKETYFNPQDSTYLNSLNQNGNAWLGQGFIHWQYKTSDRITIHPGLYFQQFTLNNSKSLEPRLAIDYLVNDKNTIGISSGLHSQTLPLFIYQYRFKNQTTGEYYQPNKKLDFMKSLHVVTSLRRSLSKNLKLKMEAYYQHLYNVPVSNSVNEFYKIYSIVNTGASYGFYASDSTVNKGKGNNYGIEITLEKYFHKGYYFLSTMSLLKSNYLAGDGIWRSTAFDIGHVLNLLGGKEFHLDKDNRKILSVDFKITSSGGRRIIPIDEQKSIVANSEQYNFNQAYNTILKDYFRTDLKISYAINREKSSHNIFIAADNLFNTKNVLEQYWNRETKQIEDAYQIGIFPYLGYRIQF